MFTKRKTLLLLMILAGITAAATLRLTLYSDAASKYSRDSNKQLQSTALGLVKNIRELVDSYNKKDRELMADYQTNYLASRTTERQGIRDQYEKNLKEANNSTVGDYKEKLLAESKTVRAELHRRLPERLHRPNLSKIYEKPSFVMEIQIIADDLELLSKSLPDS
jgi:erythromycin esterase-like protein